MRWLLAGLLFALAAALAVFTVAIRAENTRCRHRVELEYRQVERRIVEFQRLSLLRADDGSPVHLAQRHWRWLDEEAARRLERLQ